MATIYTTYPFFQKFTISEKALKSPLVRGLLYGFNCGDDPIVKSFEDDFFQLATKKLFDVYNCDFTKQKVLFKAIKNKYGFDIMDWYWANQSI